ncbi:hypothetical protein AVEN_49957-1 [Araneus ventricosus]|uniref:Uncharacterized protein n=1 Tax=Araneus ventricosus TaxID=182803 RepID=A0A4Y2EIH5_ARAVE|nr:hypothetical protein AVEN_49957-1 [Araneus ventricosus]
MNGFKIAPRSRCDLPLSEATLQLFVLCNNIVVQEFWVCWRLNNKQCSSPYTGAKPIKHAVQLEENGGLKLAFSRFSNICKMLMVERKWRQELENYLLATEKDEHADKINFKLQPKGLKGCLELKLTERIDAIECSKISKNELIKQYKDVFIGTGEFPDELYHITLKDNAIPVIHPPRRVPQALQPKLKETLDKLEKEKIVSKVNKPTDWVQSLVIVEKTNGNLR